MTSVEQHCFIRELHEHASRMTRAEQEMYEMFRKRDHDDEDLDKLSRDRLIELHRKYVLSPVRRENPLDALFRRMEGE